MTSAVHALPRDASLVRGSLFAGYGRPRAAADHRAVVVTAGQYVAITAAAAAAGTSRNAWAREVLRAAAAGALPPPGVRHTPRRARPPQRFAVRMPAAAWAALERAADGRVLAAWMADALCGAAGCRFTWSPCAEAVLRVRWRRASAAELRRALPGRTARAIAQRAQDLGLSSALDASRVPLWRAARDVGYAPQTLVKMLRAVGAAPRPILTRSSDVRRTGLTYVTRSDLARAVAAREATDTPGGFARRRGVDPRTVLRCLAWAGHRKPPGERHWRLPTAVIEAALATAVRPARPTETPLEAARRLGLRVGWLRRRLARAGHRKPAGARRWELDPAAIDAAVAAPTRPREVPTHCQRGHAYDAANTRWRAGTRTRVCRACARQDAARAYAVRARR